MTNHVPPQFAWAERYLRLCLLNFIFAEQHLAGGGGFSDSIRRVRLRNSEEFYLVSLSTDARARGSNAVVNYLQIGGYIHWALTKLLMTRVGGKPLLGADSLLFCREMKPAMQEYRFSRRARVGILALVFILLWAPLWILNRPEPTHAGQPISYWVERLNDPASTAHASSVLREMGPESVPALVDALHIKSSVISDVARDMAARVHLAPARTYDAANIRATAVYLLGQLGTNAAPATPELIEMLGDEDAIVRVKTIRTLTQVGEPALSGLTNALTNPESVVRFGAIKSLGALGQRAKPAVPALKVSLNDPRENVREAATQALTHIQR